MNSGALHKYAGEDEDDEEADCEGGGRGCGGGEHQTDQEEQMEDVVLLSAGLRHRLGVMMQAPDQHRCFLSIIGKRKAGVSYRLIPPFAALGNHCS